MVANKENKTIDLVKAIMALLILALHTPLLAENNYLLIPLYRLAVPFFFTVGSYFLFSKLNRCRTKEQFKTVFNYIGRNLALYFSWFLISLPFVYKTRYLKIFSEETEGVFVEFIKKFFLGSTWLGSWYIMATVIGTLIIFLLSKFLKNNLIFILGFASFLFCCITCSYYNAFNEYGIVHSMYESFNVFSGGYPSMSFLSGLVFIALGKILADNSKCKDFHKFRDTSLFLVSLALLFAETYYTRKMGWQRADDSLIMLVPTIYFLVKLVLQTNINIGISRFLRAFSVIVYCSQGIFFEIFNYAFELVGWKKTLKVDVCEFLLIVVFCIILTSIIVSLEKKKNMKFLRYIH